MDSLSDAWKEFIPSEYEPQSLNSPSQPKESLRSRLRSKLIDVSSRLKKRFGQAEAADRLPPHELPSESRES
jgi:hypothetical protein